MRSQKPITLVLIVSAASASLAQPGGKPEQVITQLKKACRETSLVVDGKGNAAIVIPPGDDFQAMALRVQRAIAEASGATVSIKVHSQVSEEDRAKHVMLLGNMDNNSLVERLYWQRYVACDLDYPGPGGHVVRTVCDPWGNGRNVIMLGGSDTAGVQRAVDAFLGRIAPGKSLTLPLLLDIQLPGKETITDEVLQKEWDYYREKYLNAKGLWYGCESRVHRLAYDYYLTGIEEYAKIYNQVIKRWMEEYYRFTLGRQLVTPKYAMPDMYLAWNLVEESPSITDDVRLEMTNLLYDYAIRMGEGPRVCDWKPGRMRLTGHVPLLSVLYGYDYFRKHYPTAAMMERLEAGMANVRIAMASYCQTDGFMSETGYLGIHPKLLTYYTQYTGDYTWFDNKNALRWEEYHTLVTENSGHAMGGWSPSHLLAARYYRDGRWLWLSSFQRRSSDYTTKVVNGKLRRATWLGRPDIEPVPPMDITGMRAFRMSPSWHKELSIVRGELGVRQEKAFNQVVMRVGFGKSDQYARIAGVNIGFHYGTPANAFVRLCDKGRNWLVNGRWGMSLMKYYNTVLVIHNGQACQQPPYLCSLETVCDLPEIGFVQSQMPDYNASDWMRSVVWNKQRYWLVFDTVRAQQAGDYTCVCQWRVGPRPQTEGGKAVVGAGEPALVIETTGRPVRTVIAEGSAHGTVGSHMYRQSHSGSMQPGQEAAFCSLLWVKGGVTEIEGWKRWQSDAQTARCDPEESHSGSYSLKLVNTGEMWRCLRQAVPQLEPRAKYRVRGWVRANGKVAGSIELRDPGLKKAVVAKRGASEEAWTRIEFEFDGPPKGHTAELWLLHDTYKAAGGIAWFDDLEVAKATEPTENLLTNASFEAQGDVARVMAQYALRGLADGCAIVANGSSYWLAGCASGAQTRDFSPAPGVRVAAKAFNISPTNIALVGGTALTWGDRLFASDKPVSIGVDMITGNGVIEATESSVASFAAEGATIMVAGKETRSRRVGGMVQLSVPAGRHELEIRAPRTSELLASAERIWEVAERPAASGARDLPGTVLEPTWRWRDTAIDGRPNALEMADLNRDGFAETVVGLSDGTTVVLSPDGKEICRHKAEGAVNDVACVDLNRDGKLELLSACDDSKVYATDLSGQVIWVFNNENLEITNKMAGALGIGRYASSEGEFVTLKIADIDGDGTDEILAGAKAFMHGRRRVYGTLWVLSLEGQQLWHVFNFGGTVDSIDCADIDGDGQLEIALGTGGGTYGRHQYLVDSKGGHIATYTAPYGEKLVAFARMRTGKPPALVRLERTDGTVWVHTSGKEPAHWWTYTSSGLSTTGPVVTDFDGDGAEEVLIAGASGDVYLLADAAEGHLVWRTNVGSPVTCLRAAELNSLDRILVGTRGGALIILDSHSKVLAHVSVGSDVVSMVIAPDGKWAMAGLADGHTVAIALEVKEE